MRTSNIEKAELIIRLKRKFGVDEPIFADEIITAWGEYSRPRVFQLLKTFCEDGSIAKYAIGVYYFPEKTVFGTNSVLSAVSVAEKRYLKSKGRVFGYYSGLTLLNMVGLTNQVPNTREIVTSNESTRVREVVIGKRRFLIRRAKESITSENAPLFQLLEVFDKLDRPLEKYQAENLLALAGERIDKQMLAQCAKYYPKRALQNLINSEIGYVVA